MEDIFSVDYRDSIRSVICKDMKLRYGIKIPKSKEREKSKVVENSLSGKKQFGVTLEKICCRNIKEDQYFTVPLFLDDAFNYLRNHFGLEGLFRKSGSSARQKMLREVIESGESFANCEFVHPYDIACLVKQFFRELPHPLFSVQLTSIFLKCLTFQSECDSHEALLLCVLLLPDEKLRVFKYLVDFINEVANHSSQSKMTIKNLSIVFAPNLLSLSSKDKNSEKIMKDITDVVEFLFSNSEKICMVSEEILERGANIHSSNDMVTSSSDELEENVKGCKARCVRLNSEEKRSRSKYITGLLKKGFIKSDRDKKDPNNIKEVNESGTSQNWTRNVSLEKLSISKDEEERIKLSGSSIRSTGSFKRRKISTTDASPVKKSPRLEILNWKESAIPVLKARIKSKASGCTPRTRFDSCNEISPYGKSSKTPLLPSKFEVSRVRRRSSSTNSHPYETTDKQKGNVKPKISRHTQMPHVRKTRRNSSLDRRRARFQTEPTMECSTLSHDYSETSVFLDENLTVNISFNDKNPSMEDVGKTVFESKNTKRASSRSKIPLRSSSSKITTRKDPNLPETRTHPKRVTSNPEERNKAKIMTKDNTRKKLRKSLSLGESRTTNSGEYNERESMRKKVERATTAIATPSKMIKLHTPRLVRCAKMQNVKVR